MCKEGRKYDSSPRKKKQLIKTDPEMTQMLESAYKDFKRAIKSMFKNLKKNMVLMYEQRRSVSRKIKIIKKKKMEIL